MGVDMLQQNVMLQHMQWIDVALVSFGILLYFYRRYYLQQQRHNKMANVPNSTIMDHSMKEPLLVNSNDDKLIAIEPVTLAREYQPSAPPLT